jgi:N-acetylmuramoyl-L-alanine amidase
MGSEETIEKTATSVFREPMIRRVISWLNFFETFNCCTGTIPGLIFFVFLLSFPVFAQTPARSAGTLGLEETLRALGGAAEFRWDPFFSTGVLSVGEHEAAFFSGMIGESGMVLLDHREILNLPLPYLEKGNLRFPEIFVTQLKNTFSRYLEEDHTRFRIAAIIIDPGHGGRDSGASWEYTIRGKLMKSVEKDINLKVAKLLHASLSVAFPDKRLLLTRNADTTLSLEDRVVMANSVPLAGNEAAIYISVHANSSLSNKNARGYEVWYLTPSYRREVIDRSKYADSQEVIPILNSMLEEEMTTESILLANYILKRLGESVGTSSPNRGLKSYDWFVVKNAMMPSVLVEMGFVSNETDALLMNDETYLKKLSEALYKGISDFIALFERSGGLTALR